MSSLKCCWSSDVERRKHRENRWSRFWFGWSTLRVHFHQYLTQSGDVDASRVSGVSGVEADGCWAAALSLFHSSDSTSTASFIDYGSAAFTLTLYWSFVVLTLAFTMFVHHFRHFSTEFNTQIMCVLWEIQQTHQIFSSLACSWKGTCRWPGVWPFLCLSLIYLSTLVEGRNVCLVSVSLGDFNKIK